MKKKLISLVPVCGLALGLCACGGEASQPTPPPATPSPTPALTDYTIEIPVYGLVGYDITEDVTIRDFVWDEEGRLTEKREDSTTVTYTYDEAGRIAVVTESNHYGTDTSTYTYQESGLIDSLSEGSDHSERDGNVFSYQYELDDAGQVTRQTIVNTTDVDRYTSEFTYEYNQAGYVSSEVEYGMYNDYKITPYYDAFGQLTGSSSAKVGGSSSSSRSYSYDQIGTRTLSTQTDARLVTADQWVMFDEARELPTPDSCVATIVPEEQAGGEGVYSFRLPAGTAAERFLAYDRPLTPGVQNQAQEAYLMYCAVLSDVLGYTLEEQADGSVLLSLEGTEVATLSVTLDEQYGPLMQLAFAE